MVKCLLERAELTSRLDAADDDVVDFIVSDLLVATSGKTNKETMDYSNARFLVFEALFVHTCCSTSTA